MRLGLISAVLVSMLGSAAVARAQGATSYRVLATNKTSTMQKELQQAAEAGFRFVAVMGGETSFGGSEVVVVMQRIPSAARYEYRLLATNKTSTMQKELQQAAEDGFSFVGQTVFSSTFGGSEVGVILERDPAAARQRFQYKLIAASKTSTLQKELQDAGELGFQALGMTVGQTALGGSEIVVITRRIEQ